MFYLWSNDLPFCVGLIEVGGVFSINVLVSFLGVNEIYDQSKTKFDLKQSFFKVHYWTTHWHGVSLYNRKKKIHTKETFLLGTEHTALRFFCERCLFSKKLLSKKIWIKTCFNVE